MTEFVTLRLLFAQDEQIKLEDKEKYINFDTSRMMEKLRSDFDESGIPGEPEDHLPMTVTTARIKLILMISHPQPKVI